MNLSDTILKSILSKFEFEELNDLQNQTIQLSEFSDEIVISAPTGTGKTLAFLLPMISKLNEEDAQIRALILAPTRELAIQIGDVFQKTGISIKSSVFYGGHEFKTERNSLSHPPGVLIGTPGRIADHIRRETIDLNLLRVLIIDEFDKALELGFEDEMQEILAAINQVSLKILTSATPINKLPDYLRMKDPSFIKIDSEEIESNLKIYYVKMHSQDKLHFTQLLLSTFNNEPTLLFCNHREAAERIQSHLSSSSMVCDVFHGGLKQEERERALIKMRNGSITVLVCTDLAARGLDIPEIKHVIHYQPSNTKATFIHRNGRTARVHAEGAAYLLLDENERLPDFIENDLKPEAYSLPTNIVTPALPIWESIYFGAGKKDKINKIDLLGAITKLGKLKGDDVGRIDVLDHHSFVAVKRGQGKNLVTKLFGQPIKKKKFKIALSN